MLILFAKNRKLNVYDGFAFVCVCGMYRNKQRRTQKKTL